MPFSISRAMVMLAAGACAGTGAPAATKPCSGYGEVDTCAREGKGYCKDGDCAPCATDAQCGGENFECREGKCFFRSEAPVPAGPFMMGCNSAVDTQCESSENPYHEVMLSAYHMDTTEVTETAFKACVDAGGCVAPHCIGASGYNWEPATHGRHPMRCVTWQEAKAFCAWAGKRLPTEAEWEKAARGTDGRIYPWGNETATCRRAAMFGRPDEGCGTHAIVWDVAGKSTGDSPYRMHDMAGNASEWVNDWFDAGYYAVGPSADPQGPEQSPGGTRVVKGGSFRDHKPEKLRASARLPTDPGLKNDVIGFRCARGAP